jgi:hypothetical protein
MSIDYAPMEKINNCEACNGTGIQGWLAGTDGELYDVTRCDECNGEPTEKWIVRAVFRHNNNDKREAYTYYDRVWWPTEQACLHAIANAPIMETLAQAASLDTETEDDLQGFYLDDFEPFKMSELPYKQDEDK